MGRPRVKTIDDSAPVEVKKEVKPEKKAKDSLVAKLQAELGIEEPKTEAKAETVENVTPSKEASEPEKTTQPRKISTSAKPPRDDKRTRSKKYLETIQDLDRTLAYSIAEAIDIVKNKSYSKFNGSLEAHINTRVASVRGMVNLPFTSGKKRTILAFGKGAEGSGADLVGDDKTIASIEAGKIDFDILIATPEWMPKLAKAARVLGPRGLMPNPKNNTVTDDLKKAVESFQGGQTEYKTENKAPVIHLSLGKLNQPTQELESNVKILLQTIGKSRIKKVTLAPTMGPSVKINLASL